MKERPFNAVRVARDYVTYVEQEGLREIKEHHEDLKDMLDNDCEPAAKLVEVINEVEDQYEQELDRVYAPNAPDQEEHFIKTGEYVIPNDLR